MTALLEGIRVIDFTHVHAGPLCTYQLALMGAEIIKIESPDGGDQFRGPGDGLAPGFLGQSANKQSIAIDIKSEQGLALIHRLVASGDVLVQNLRPGTADRLGIGFDTCKGLNPGLVYCAISGYGQEGPGSERPAFDHLIQGESGMFMATGLEDQPVRVGFAVADAATALNASSAINAALVRRATTGEGALLDVSMLESCMTLMGLNYYNFLATGRNRKRVGPNPLAPQGSAGTFPTADDRLLLVNANSYRLFQRLAEAVDLGDLLEDPRYANQDSWFENADALRHTLAELFSTRDAAHWDKLLADAGVPAGIAKNPAEVLENPQLAYRRSITELEHVPGRDDGRLRFLNAGFQVDGEPTAPDQPPPRLGEHADAILETLGLSDDEIAALRDAGDIL